MLKYFICVIIGYLLGSLSFGIIISKLFYKKDVRDFGSNNAGMTNTMRTFGKKAGIAVFIGDFLKPIVACIIAVHLVSGGENAAVCGYVAGIAAVLGHMFPVFFGFRGGKGVASMFGIAAVMSPVAVPVLAAVFFICLAFSKMVSLSSILAAITFPVITFIIYRFSLPNFACLEGSYVIPTVITAIIGALVIFMHRSNIQRIVKGEERKVGKKK